MPLVTDKFHSDKLKKYNLNIKTKYIVGDKILERNSNNSYNDDIKNGIRCQKDYYLGKEVIHKETIFDSRIEYTFISKNEENKTFKCPNCGMESNVKDFIDCCPFCRTNYNIDYTEKDLGSKYHYDLILRNTTYRIITGIVDLIVSLILSYFFIKFTSRTFNSYDISKIFIYGIILSLVLYYFFYILDAYIVLSPIKKYKEEQNKKQIEFWDKTKIDKKTFFNNLNFELNRKYYKEQKIVDYDVIDYLEFNEIEKDSIKVKIDVRIVYFENNKIKSKYINDEFIMKKQNKEVLELKDGINYIKCHNCGASIDATKGYCEFCNSEILPLQEWRME